MNVKQRLVKYLPDALIILGVVWLVSSWQDQTITVKGTTLITADHGDDRAFAALLITAGGLTFIRRLLKERRPDNSTNTSLRVVADPAVVGGTLMRLVSDGSTDFVESWDGRAWQLGGGTVDEVLKAPSASPETLRKFNASDQ